MDSSEQINAQYQQLLDLTLQHFRMGISWSRLYIYIYISCYNKVFHGSSLRPRFNG